MNMERPWTVPTAHPSFPGHFPGRPILPGVVLVDQALRLAADLLPAGSAIRGLGTAKFFRPVGPGTALLFRYAPTSTGAIAFEVRDGAQLVASGSISFGPRS